MVLVLSLTWPYACALMAVTASASSVGKLGLFETRKLFMSELNRDFDG